MRTCTTLLAYSTQPTALIGAVTCNNNLLAVYMTISLTLSKDAWHVNKVPYVKKDYGMYLTTQCL